MAALELGRLMSLKALFLQGKGCFQKYFYLVFLYIECINFIRKKHSSYKVSLFAKIFILCFLYTGCPKKKVQVSERILLNSERKNLN